METKGGSSARCKSHHFQNVRRLITSILQALESKKEALAALKAELDEKTAELNGIRGVEIEMRNKLEENQKVLAENQKRSQYWHEKLSKLSINNIRFVVKAVFSQHETSFKS